MEKKKQKYQFLRDRKKRSGKMTQDMWNIVNVCRANGVSVTDEEAISIYEYCLRKMDIAKVANQEEYFLFLFADDTCNPYGTIIALNIYKKQQATGGNYQQKNHVFIGIF